MERLFENLPEKLARTCRWLLATIVFSLLLKMVGCAIAGEAATAATASQEHCHTAASSIDDARRIIVAARSRHAVRYLQNVSVNAEASLLDEAQRYADEAIVTPDPDEKLSSAASAEAILAKIGTNVGTQTAYLQSLDTALAGYRDAQNRLERDCASAAASINDIVAKGYFERHFTPMRKALLELQGAHFRSVKLAEIIIDSDKRLPDYVQIYSMCQEADSKVTAAVSGAAAIPAFKELTDGIIAQDRTRLSNLDSLYASAMAAVSKLQDYPRYDYSAKVEKARVALAPLPELIVQAERENSFARQEFEIARQRAADVNERIDASALAFNKAVDAWNRVSRAVAQMHSALTDANSAIDRASTHIRNNGQNSQSSAESELDDARSSYSLGIRLAKSDPPRALSAFRSAQSQAESAYQAVDTSTPSSDDDDDDSSSSSPSLFGGSSGSSGSSGGSSSSSNRSSGGSTSRSSGSSIGPSRPSGGGAGGPRGGGAGRGGF